ncbi:MAG: Helix-turn-helix type 11 domain protein [Solirubrobacterales bacterium]|nr:Helix-turn-helix type 11 domain protein [Solirubrobacterales bacterium]
MADAPTAGRLLAMLSLLQGRREWPGTLLATRLQVSLRTVRRDVERLRGLGYPIDSTSGPAGGYSLTAGAAMPPLLLDDDEAIAVAIALRTAARSAVTGIEETALRALVKLEQVLPEHLRRRVRALGAATEVVRGSAGPTVDAAALTVLGTACRDEEMLRFAYRGRDGAQSRRLVEPHALLAHGRRWYLLAFDPSRTAWRTFRVDRVSSPAQAGVRFAPRTVPGGDPAAYLTRTLAGVVYRHEARVRYHVSAAELRGRVPGWNGLRDGGDGTCVYDTSDDDLDWLAFRIAAPNVDFELEQGPAELRERLHAMGRRLQAAAQADGSGSSRSASAKQGRARSSSRKSSR